MTIDAVEASKTPDKATAGAPKPLNMKALERIRETGRHAVGNGLYLQIATGGARSWVYRYQHHGRRHDLGLGPFPAVTLAMAREDISRVRQQLHRNEDLLALKRAERAAAKAEVVRTVETFDMAAESYIAAHPARLPSARVAHHRQPRPLRHRAGGNGCRRPGGGTMGQVGRMGHVPPAGQSGVRPMTATLLPFLPHLPDAPDPVDPGDAIRFSRAILTGEVALPVGPRRDAFLQKTAANVIELRLLIRLPHLHVLFPDPVRALGVHSELCRVVTGIERDEVALCAEILFATITSACREVAAGLGDVFDAEAWTNTLVEVLRPA